MGNLFGKLLKNLLKRKAFKPFLQSRRKAPYRVLSSSWGYNSFTLGANIAFGWHSRALWALREK